MNNRKWIAYMTPAHLAWHENAASLPVRVKKDNTSKIYELADLKHYYMTPSPTSTQANHKI